MSKIDTILSELTDISKHPRKAMEDFKAKTGKGAIGVLPIYAPEEIVYATGYLPMGIYKETDFKSSYMASCIYLFNNAVNNGT